MKNKPAAWTTKLAVFDLETTGLDVFTDRIVTAAVCLLDNGQVVQRYDWIINPGVPIPPQAIAVHGITNEVAAASGMTASAGVAQIIEKLRYALAAGYTLVAFNANYDFTLLNHEAQRHLGDTVTDLAPIIDPYIIDRFLDRYRRGKRRLVEMAKHYGVALDNAHEAAADAIAAGHLAIVLAEKFADKLPQDAYLLHDLQIEWESELTLSFRKYLESEGKPFTHVLPGWPIRNA